MSLHIYFDAYFDPSALKKISNLAIKVPFLALCGCCFGQQTVNVDNGLRKWLYGKNLDVGNNYQLFPADLKKAEEWSSQETQLLDLVHEENTSAV